jgi:hypothetical protein
LVSEIPANPVLTLSAPSSATVGSALDPSTVQAVLSAGASPAGAITFRVFGPQPSAPGGCAAGGTIVGSANVSGDGAYHPSAGFSPTSPGDYWWYASYDGDASDSPAASACGAQMPETVVASIGGGTGGPGGVTGGPSGVTGGPGGVTGGPGGVTGAGKLRVGRLKVVGSSLRVPLSCSRAPCRVTLKLTGTKTLKGSRVVAEDAATRKHQLVTFATARVALTAGQSKTIRLALNATGKRLLAELHQLKTKLNISEFGKVLSNETVTFRAIKHKTARMRR